ncbi:hypothetical protein AB0442_39855 [Kitasatospora sp. NPDC085895]|uniref:hypothetical protein n=1 Tax=Kitasatospora sp. NPDC085895 TaxID=3155057 RepID=UPI00344DA4B8
MQNTCTATTQRGSRCRNPPMRWYGLGPSPEVCSRHATAEQQAASTAALDLPFNYATADPNAPFPGITISPRYLACDDIDGWVAKINGTHAQYNLARTFLNRVGPAPYG